MLSVMSNSNFLGSLILKVEVVYTTDTVISLSTYYSFGVFFFLIKQILLISLPYLICVGIPATELVQSTSYKKLVLSAAFILA